MSPLHHPIWGLLLSIIHSTAAQNIPINITANMSVNFTSTYLDTTIYTPTQFITTLFDSGHVALFGLGMNDLIVIGIILAVVVFICIIICCIFQYKKYKQKQEKRKDINNVDDIDKTQAKIDAFHVHISHNALAAHSAQTAYNPNPLRVVKSLSSSPINLEPNTVGSNPPSKPLTVGDIMMQKQMEMKDQPTPIAVQTVNNPPPINVATAGTDDLKPKHLKVNLFEEEEESLRTLELTPHTPTGTREDSAISANTNITMKYMPTPVVMGRQITDRTETPLSRRSLTDDPSGDDTPTVNDSNDSTYDIAPVKVVDTLTAMIQQHQSEEEITQIESNEENQVPDTLTMIDETQMMDVEDNGQKQSE